MQNSFLEELENKVKAETQLYHATGQSNISDADFDDLLDQVSAIDATNELLVVTGNGFSVDSMIKDNNLSEKEKFKHPITVGSIVKIKSIVELKKWIKPGCTFSTKIDGNSIVHYYDTGLLKNVVTRGKDDIGIIRTNKFIGISPQTIPLKEHIAVRGEAAIAKSKYTAENGFDLTKSSRNAVAGAITRKDDWKNDFKHVDFIAYTFVNVDTGEDLYDKFDWSTLFTVETQKPVNIADLDNIEEFRKKYKDNYSHDADGVVFKNPDGEMRAFKFEDESVWTPLEKVKWPIGVDQRLTPVTHLTPVQLAGATISKASVGSYNKAVALGVWPVRKDPKKPHIVKIVRANEIIPHIVTSNYAGEPATADELAVYCPVCGTKGEVNGEHIFCVNTKCPNIEKSKLYSFSENFYPESLSDKIIEKVFDRYHIKNLEDLLTFDFYPVDFSKIEGIGNSHANLVGLFFSKIHDNIDSTIIYKSILNSCGRSFAIKIVENMKFKDYIDLYKVDNEVVSKLRDIPGFHSNIITELLEHREYIAKLSKLCKITDKILDNVTGTFAITGTRFSKTQLDSLLRLGWKEDSSLKKTTKVLVVADINSNSDKIQKARKYGVKIMDIEGFLESALTDEQEGE